MTWNLLGQGAMMIVVAMALAHYSRSGLRQISILRASESASDRLTFFRSKAFSQFLVMMALPILAISVCQFWPEVLHPAPAYPSALKFFSQLTGLQPEDIDQFPVLHTLMTIVAVIVALELIPLLLRSKHVIMLGNAAVLRGRNPVELGYLSVLSVQAGIGEELLFRGLIPALLIGLGVAPATAFLVAIGIFGLMHAYQGMIGVITTTAIAVVLTTIYLISNSLLAVAVLHVTIDIIGLVVRPIVGLMGTGVLRKVEYLQQN